MIHGRKWGPCTWVNGVITLVIGAIPKVITGRGPTFYIISIIFLSILYNIYIMSVTSTVEYQNFHSAAFYNPKAPWDVMGCQNHLL